MFVSLNYYISFLYLNISKFNQGEDIVAIEWKPELATGFTEIDNQHKELFKRINDLLDAMRIGKGKEEVGKVLKFLEDYTVYHFGNEENYMKKHNYPDYEGHKAQHTSLINDIQAMRAQFTKEGASSLLVIDIQKELGDWLMVHIGHVDKALGKFLNEISGNSSIPV
jgi:hemerythrin